MSAYLVNDDTLDLLASVATNWAESAHDSGLPLYLSHSVAKPLTLDLIERVELGVEDWRVNITNTMGAMIKRELLIANLASLETRYPSTEPGDGWQESERAPFRQIVRGEVRDGEALGALRCYEYQSCEVENWADSFAYHLSLALRRKIAGFIAGDAWEYRRPNREALRAKIEANRANA